METVGELAEWIGGNGQCGLRIARVAGQFLLVKGHERGYLLGVTSDRKLVMELQCNMALRWFVGLNLDEQPWDVACFGNNAAQRVEVMVR